MNPPEFFPALADDARLWVYAAAEPMVDVMQETLESELRRFFDAWQSHSRAATGDVLVLERRFIVIAGMLQSGGVPSGCSIDSLARMMEKLTQRLGIALLSPLLVHYRRQDGMVQSVSRGAFRRLVQEGEVSGGTLVFDVGIDRVRALRSGAFEQPFARSWHSRVFRPRAAKAG